MSQTSAVKRSVGALNKALGIRKRLNCGTALSFRQRRRKSNIPCIAPTNPIRDEFLFWPSMIRLAIKKTNISLPNLEKKGAVVTNIDDQGQVMSQKTSDACPPPSERQQQQQELPLGFKDYIKELGVTGDPVLVIQKRLFASDVNRGLQRLLIPVRQVINHGFLTEVERSRLNSEDKQEGIDAILIEPSLAQSGIKLKKWHMGTSESFVLLRGWNNVVKRNGLKAGQIVQLWSFKKGLQLYFVLVQMS